MSLSFNPSTGQFHKVEAADASPVVPKVLGQDIITDKAKDRLYQILQREQLPTDIDSTLKGALRGDLRMQGALFDAMLDTWPRLQSNMDEMRGALMKAKFKVEPFAVQGEESTEAAVDRARFVETALRGMKPKALKAQLAYKGIVRCLADSYFTGHSVIELLWYNDKEGNLVPKYGRSLHWTYFGYPQMTDEDDELALFRDGIQYAGKPEEFTENKFLVGVAKAHNAHPSIAARLRALVPHWIATVYGMKWLLQFAQTFGMPIRWATYTDSTQLRQIEHMLQKIGSSAYGAFPHGTELELKQATSGGAQNLPQNVLQQNADTACDIYILGQSLTTSTGGSGSRALGEVHNDVRLDKFDMIADYVDDVIQHQLVQPIIELNYGNDDDMPTFTIEIERPKDETKLAERDKTLVDMGMNILEDELYKRHNLTKPEKGDVIFTPTKMQDNNNPNGAQGEPATGGKKEELQPNSLPHETKEVKAAHSEPTTSDLADSVLEDITKGDASFLSGVKPHFVRLMALATADVVTDDDFIEALEASREQLPELFDDIKIDQLQEALENSMNTAMAAGIHRAIVK